MCLVPLLIRTVRGLFARGVRSGGPDDSTSAQEVKEDPLSDVEEVYSDVADGDVADGDPPEGDLPCPLCHGPLHLRRCRSEEERGVVRECFPQAGTTVVRLKCGHSVHDTCRKKGSCCVTCAICLELVHLVGSEFYTWSCGHHFHKECARRVRGDTCPLCRQNHHCAYCFKPMNDVTQKLLCGHHVHKTCTKRCYLYH